MAENTTRRCVKLCRFDEIADPGARGFEVDGTEGRGGCRAAAAVIDGPVMAGPDADVLSALETITGAAQEHGIGTEKRATLASFAPARRLSTMRAIKQALDPHNVMNPGKIL